MHCLETARSEILQENLLSKLRFLIKYRLLTRWVYYELHGYGTRNSILLITDNVKKDCS